MSILSTVPASTTEIINRNFCPEILTLGTVADNDPRLRALKIQIGGEVKIDLSSADNIKALAALSAGSFMVNQDLPVSQIVLASGRINNAETDITVDNPAGASIAVGQYSFGADGVPLVAGEFSVQADTQRVFSNGEFDYLLFDPTNFDRATIEFLDGWTEVVTVEELKKIMLQLSAGYPAGATFFGKVLLNMNVIASISIMVNSSAKMDFMQVTSPIVE